MNLSIGLLALGYHPDGYTLMTCTSFSDKWLARRYFP